MAVILAFIEVHKPHNHEKTRNSLLIIQMEKSYNECARGPPGLNISEGFGGVMVPGPKALSSVDNNSLSCGVGWRQFVGP